MPPDPEHPVESLLLLRLLERARTISVFLVGQGLSQGLSLVAGFYLLRWMNVLEYSKYSVAFGFQATLTILTDLGFAGTVVALVGHRVSDREVIGSYISSGRYVRNWMIVVLAPLASIAYLRIAKLHNWSAASTMALLASTVTSIYWSGIGSYYSAPLLINRKLGVFYRNQTISSGFRLVGFIALFLRGTLSAWNAAWIGTLATGLLALLNKRSSGEYVNLPKQHDDKALKQMFQYVLPNLPMVFFYALQGQISLLLVSFFGHTQNIAEVGALGRLAQFFVLLGGFNSVVIEPYMARLQERWVRGRYLLISFLGAMFCIALCLSAFRFPWVFLLLLGPRYASTSNEIGWLIMGSSFAYMVGLLWTMGAARRWVYWSTSWLTIALILITQITLLVRVPMNSTRNVVLFGVATSAAHLTSMIVNSFIGLKRGPRIKILGESVQV